jgi:uncharacterized membrane protein HdeD (DUF308 family)
VSAARWLVLSLLLLAPQVHPWYLLWLLPLELWASRRVVLVWSAAVLIAYAPVELWSNARVWQEPAAGALVQYGLVGLALALEFAMARGPVARPARASPR